MFKMDKIFKIIIGVLVFLILLMLFRGMPTVRDPKNTLAGNESRNVDSSSIDGGRVSPNRRY